MDKLEFIKIARGKTLFVDVDGTILTDHIAPADVLGRDRFIWWNENLHLARPIYSRLLFLVAIKALGAKLVLWTNRPLEGLEVTRKSLGLFWYLFSDYQFHCGKKHKSYDPAMFVMDNDAHYAGANTLTVETL